jgi:N-acetylneuraminic acid mutarotase
MFDCYDPATDTWTILPDATHIRDHCSAAVVKDRLYVAGGRNTSYHEPDNFTAFFSHTVLDVDCYDFATGKWSTLEARLPLGSGGGALVNCKDVLYYMGGERATATEPNAPRKNTYYLDPSTKNEWKETDPLHYGRNGMPAAVLNNQIYVAGGSGGGPGGPPPGGFGARGMRPPDSSRHIYPPLSAQRQNGSDKITVEVFTVE